MPVSKQFSDRSKAKGSKITSLFPSISSHAVHPSTLCQLPPLLTPTPVCPHCCSRLCSFCEGLRSSLFVQLRASSQEISCDGNSGETSCWLGHCRGLITWTTYISKPQPPRRVDWFLLAFSKSGRARKCKCTEARVSHGRHFLEAESHRSASSCRRPALVVKRTASVSNEAGSCHNGFLSGSIEGLETVSGVQIWLFFIILTHIPISLQYYGFTYTTNIYFQPPVMDWEF